MCAELNHNPRRKTLTSGLHTSDFKHPHVSDFLFAGVVDSVNVRFQLKLVEERERQRGLESRRSSSQFGHGNTLYFLCFFFPCCLPQLPRKKIDHIVVLDNQWLLSTENTYSVAKSAT